MKWNWDFFRGRKTAIPAIVGSALKAFPASPRIKMAMINGHAHPIQGGDLSDMEVAGQVRMLMRTDLNHESVCTLARDRIVYLSDRLDEVTSITAEQIGEAIYEVANRWIGPNFPTDWKPTPFSELQDRDRRLHLDYGAAVLALIKTDTPPVERAPELQHGAEP